MDRKELEALLRLLKRHDVEEFTLETAETTVSIRFAGGGRAPAVEASAPVVAPAGPGPTPARAEKPAAEVRTIAAPIVGTFYRAPAPDAAPYVKEGDRVRKGQVVCIIEAMKLMNQIESDVDGVVLEILVENATPVQFGQALFRIGPG